MLGVSPNIRYVDIIPTVLNADAYDSGDVLFDVTEIPGACSGIGIPTRLVSIVAIDQDDQAAAVWVLHFLNGTGTFGTKDSAPSISDANALFHLGYVSIPSASFLDIGGAKVACVDNINKVLIPAEATASVYVAATVTGTPTQTTGGIKLRFGFVDL